MSVAAAKSGYITKTASVYDNTQQIGYDLSSNNFTLSRDQGLVYPDNSSLPYAGAGNTFKFGGNAGYYTLSSNSAFGFGTGDFTIEGWFKIDTSFTGNKVFLDFRTGQTLVFGFSSLKPYFYNGSDRISSTALTVGTWAHVAWVRSSGNYRMYLNGTSTYGPLAGTQGTASANVWLGVGEGGTFGWPMTVSNFRIVKGTAVYTSSFTPPSSDLTAISGTSLLLASRPYGGVKTSG
jgi:hypothetical protein